MLAKQILSAMIWQYKIKGKGLMPKISVIVPIYNAAPYLPRCLDSILCQSMADFELICVNDGSLDESDEILTKYAGQDTRVKVINQNNRGVSAARNCGLAACSADYVCFVDADDYIHPDMLGIMYSAITENDADVAIASMKNVYETSCVKFLPIVEDKLKYSIQNHPFEAFLNDKKIRSVSNARLYRTSLLKNIRFIEGIRYEDVPFTVEVMQNACKLALVDAQLYYYFQHDNSFMHQPFTSKNVFDYEQVITSVYNLCQTKTPDKLFSVRKNILNQRFKMMINQTVRRQKNPAEQKIIFNQIQKVVKSLYQKGMLSYDGLKIKHKIRLFLLLKCKNPEPCRIWSNLI